MLDLPLVRQHFPALDRSAIFLDNPAGTQISDTSLERIRAYLLNHNANHGGAFATSRASDALIDQAHAAMADLLNAPRAEEIVFGANMTSLPSASAGRLPAPGSRVIGSSSPGSTTVPILPPG